MKKILIGLLTVSLITVSNIIPAANAYTNTCVEDSSLLISPRVEENGWTVKISGTASDDRIVINLDKKPFSLAREIIIYAGDGNDFVCVDGSSVDSAQRVWIYGGNGNDILKGHSSLRNRIYGGYGDDKLYGGNAKDNLYGGFMNTKIRDTGADFIMGFGERDVLYAGSSEGSVLDGGEHNDVLMADEFFSAELYGGNGNDMLLGSVNSDVLNAGAGNDLVYVSSKRNAKNAIDVIDAGDGNDIIFLHNVKCLTSSFTLDTMVNTKDTIWLTKQKQRLCFADLSEIDKIKRERKNKTLVS